MFKLSSFTIVGLFVLICILGATVSLAVMQVIRTVGEGLVPGAYVVGGSIFLAGILIPVMLVFIIKHLKRIG